MTSLRTPTTGTASSSTALSVAKPSGTAAGDLILVFATAVGVTCGPITGFADSGNAATGNANARAYVRTADGTEGSSFGITLGAATSVGAAICAVYASPASTDPSGTPSVFVHSSTGTSVAVPAITLAGSTDWLAWFGAGLTAGVVSWTLSVPSGFTSQATIPAFNNGTNSLVAAFADIESAQAAGSTGIQAGTLSTAGHCSGWMVGISPAAPPSVNTGGLLPIF